MDKKRLTKCRSCKAEVSYYAKICPHCGDRRPSATGCFPIIILLILGWVIFEIFQIANHP